MSKLRSDSKWNELTPEQRELLDGWLFVERLGYRETQERAKKEFGIEASLTSLYRYYQHTSLERLQKDDVELSAARDGIEVTAADVERWRRMALRLVGTRLVRLAAHEPDNVRDVERLTQLLLDSERKELQARRLALELRREESDMARQKEQERKKAERLKEWQAMMADLTNPPRKPREP